MLIRHNSSPGPGGEMCPPVAESARAITTAGQQSLLGWPTGIPAVPDCTSRTLEPPRSRPRWPSALPTGS